MASFLQTTPCTTFRRRTFYRNSIPIMIIRLERGLCSIPNHILNKGLHILSKAMNRFWHSRFFQPISPVTVQELDKLPRLRCLRYDAGNVAGAGNPEFLVTD